MTSRHSSPSFRLRHGLTVHPRPLGLSAWDKLRVALCAMALAVSLFWLWACAYL